MKLLTKQLEKRFAKVGRQENVKLYLCHSKLSVSSGENSMARVIYPGHRTKIIGKSIWISER